MLDTVFGLPFHPLVVHATVVVVPAAALAVLLAAVLPRFRRWAGVLPLLLSAAALVLVPLSTQSGEALERRVGESALVRRHAELADGLLPWVIVLVVAAAALYWVARRERASGGTRLRGVPVLVVAAVVGIVGSAGTVVQVARIGHSGAQSAWSDVAKQQPSGGDQGDGDGK